MSGKASTVAAEIVESADASLLDIIDHVLNKGLVLQGEVILAVADVDLVYLRLTALLCGADRLEQGGEWGTPRVRDGGGGQR